VAILEGLLKGAPMLLEKPNWTLWADMTHVSIDNAVALSCNLEPTSIGKFPASALAGEKGFAEYQRRQKIAASQLAANRILGVLQDADLYSPSIELSVFRAWAERLQRPFTFPAEFPKASSIPSPTAVGSWPWGDYETKNLRLLADAAAKFWKNYDPSDPSTAPKNKVVSEWLVEKNVARRVAEVMAHILRADGLRTGPR
jgi:hypothetical protein